MTKHTPGPWRAEPFQVVRDPEDDELIDTRRIRTADGAEVIADVYGLESFAAADARLMSAAPDLLDELIDMRNQFLSDADGPYVGSRKRMRDSVDAAIAKATGEGQDS